MVDNPGDQDKELQAKIQGLLAEVDEREVFRDDSGDKMMEQLKDLAGQCHDKGLYDVERQLLAAIEEVKSKSETW
jgi:hypothetical protein